MDSFKTYLYVRIFFQESECLRTRKTMILYIVMVSALVSSIILGMLAFMLGSAFIFGYPDEGTKNALLSIVIILIGSLTVFMISSIKYREVSRVEVREDGLLLDKKIIEWDKIDDMKFSTETYVDLEVGGGPVVGYGMYGYALSRSITKHVYRYVDVQLFHKNGVDEIQFTPKEF
ncbi:MAG: hypothetical protein QW655_04330 [Nitrososphaerota archaeon]|nr:hypothetical protein [Candidatus Geocrenenecus dongiae]